MEDDSKKTEMTRIEDKADTFNKLRCELFENARELQKLTGAEISVVVISEDGETYLEGSETLVDSFLSQEAKPEHQPLAKPEDISGGVDK